MDNLYRCCLRYKNGYVDERQATKEPRFRGAISPNRRSGGWFGRINSVRVGLSFNPILQKVHPDGSIQKQCCPPEKARSGVLSVSMKFQRRLKKWNLSKSGPLTANILRSVSWIQINKRVDFGRARKVNNQKLYFKPHTN